MVLSFIVLHKCFIVCKSKARPAKKIMIHFIVTLHYGGGEPNLQHFFPSYVCKSFLLWPLVLVLLLWRVPCTCTNLQNVYAFLLFICLLSVCQTQPETVDSSSRKPFSFSPPARNSVDHHRLLQWWVHVSICIGPCGGRGEGETLPGCSEQEEHCRGPCGRARKGAQRTTPPLAPRCWGNLHRIRAGIQGTVRTRPTGKWGVTSQEATVAITDWISGVSLGVFHAYIRYTC